MQYEYSNEPEEDDDEDDGEDTDAEAERNYVNELILQRSRNRHPAPAATSDDDNDDVGQATISTAPTPGNYRCKSVNKRLRCLYLFVCTERRLSYGSHSGVVVSALGMRTGRRRFESRVVPLFHWVATVGKLFTRIASAVSQLQETGVQKGVFGA